MATYTITIAELEEFLQSNLPYVTYDQYDNITRFIRDTKFAPEKIHNFYEGFGTSFFMWTKRLSNEYLHNIFFNKMEHPLIISVEIPRIDNMATFPLAISLSSGGEIYFEQTQKLMVQKIVDGKAITSGWSRVPELRKAVMNNAKDIRLSPNALKRLEQMDES